MTVLMVGFGSLIIGICPTYAQIGIAAPIIIVAARLLQGFSAGGEFQIAITFLNEHAASRNRAFAASPQLVSIGLAVLAASGIASLTTRAVPPPALAALGWSLPLPPRPAVAPLRPHLPPRRGPMPSLSALR